MKVGHKLIHAGLSALVCVVSASAENSSGTQFVSVPNTVSLTHNGASHSLVIEQTNGDLFVGDVTAKAQFSSSDPAVAEVDAKGIVRAIGNGETTVSATVNGQAVETKVTVAGVDKPYVPSFRNNVAPLLFKMGCNTGACHGAAAGKNGFKLSLRGFDFDWDHKVLTRQANGRRLSLSEPEQSLMLLKATMQMPHGGGERFDKGSESYRILLNWIEAGAPPAAASDPVVQSIETMPKSVKLTKNATQQLVVRANYNDGKYEDVSRWVKYATTDDSVATVDDNGRITVTGPGAASITAWYASKVSAVRVLVPRDKPVAPERFARAESYNYIDELVARQLKGLQIAPTGIGTDAEFIRRASLDATGVLPAPEDVETFVFDTDS